MLRLITIPLSHYCEKARWALDRGGLAYHEEQHLQMLHRFSVKRAGGGHTVPVLITDAGVLAQSRDIVRFVDRTVGGDRPLYPAATRAEIDAHEARFDEYGVHTRRLAYSLWLPHRALMLRYNNVNAPAWEKALLHIAYPLARRFVMRYLECTEEGLAESRAHVARILDEVGAQLEDGRRYLLGEHFSAPDLAFAAMSGPLILPKEYGVPLPDIDELPSDLGAPIRSFRDHPAGRFALRLFAQERRSEVSANPHMR